MKLAFREADLGDSDDRMFVISTWSSSFKKSYSAGLIRSEDWAGIMHDQLGKILARDGARVLLAFEAKASDFLYGWVAGDTSERMPFVYYVYVKEPYRRSGIARALLEAFGVDVGKPFTYVCQTPIVSQLRSKLPLARWNPLEVRYPKEARRGKPWPNQ